MLDIAVDVQRVPPVMPQPCQVSADDSVELVFHAVEVTWPLRRHDALQLVPSGAAQDVQFRDGLQVLHKQLEAWRAAKLVPLLVVQAVRELEQTNEGRMGIHLDADTDLAPSGRLRIYSPTVPLSQSQGTRLALRKPTPVRGVRGGAESTERLANQPLGKALTGFIGHDQRSVDSSDSDTARLPRQPTVDLVIASHTSRCHQAACLVDRRESGATSCPAQVNTDIEGPAHRIDIVHFPSLPSQAG